MKNYCLIYEYDSGLFMNIDKIIYFKKNIEEVEKKGNNLKMLFYGETSNEELSTFMSYFNKLVGKKICDISISFETKELIEETGVNNKRIELSALNSLDVTSRQFGEIIQDYYGQNIEIKALHPEDWESNILSLIGE